MSINLGKIGVIAGAIAAPIVGVAVIRALSDHDDRRGAHQEAPNGVTTTWNSHVPDVLNYGLIDAQMYVGGAMRFIGDHLGAKPNVSSDSAKPLDQARASWTAMKHSMGDKGEDGWFSMFDANRYHIASSWPMGQVLAGALDVAARTGDYHDVNAVTSHLAEFLHRGGASQGIVTKGHHNLYDDNAWLGLDMMQAFNQTGDASYLDSAKATAAYLETGLSPQGGMYWGESEHPMTRNTCSNAPTEQLMLRLYQSLHAQGSPDAQHYLDVATNIERFRSTQLVRADGLYGDNVADGTGAFSDAVYSYNQGTPIGADVLWYQTTGDVKYLDRARATADAALAYYGSGDRLWNSAPVFNAIMFRNLLQLDAVAPDPRIRTMMTSYLERARTEARDPGTGLYARGGIGRYESVGSMSTIDQAAFVQMYALLDWPTDQLHEVS